MSDTNPQRVEPAQHTPGPWHIGMNPGPIIYGERGDQVANMCDGLYGDDENRANARLIAAAPDMLAVLLAIAEGEDYLTINQFQMDRVEAAIARATGSEPA